jgi:DNA-binding NarL/FixJ family response regulator
LITIVLSDDQVVAREAVRRFLEEQPDLRVVGESTDFRSTIEAVRRAQPDILLVAATRADFNPARLLENLTAYSPATRMVVFSIRPEKQVIPRTIREVAACLSSDSTSEDLLNAIRNLSGGGRYRSRARAPSPPDSKTDSSAAAMAATLTPREREVLDLVAEGLPTAEIARRLAISPRTVDSHRASMLRKLGLQSHWELIRYSLRLDRKSGDRR